MTENSWRLAATRGLALLGNAGHKDPRSLTSLRWQQMQGPKFGRLVVDEANVRRCSTATRSRARTATHAFPLWTGRPRQDISKQALHCRSLFTESLPTYLVPPAVFVSLLLTLWTYKCLMTILFQDKIIYMPYIGRSENMYDYATACRPVEWQETHIKSLDGTDIALCVGSLSPKASRPSRHLVICYFQGNGSSPPPRLPMLSNVLKSIETQMPTSNVHFTIVALAYRGYWTSSGRSSQPGIEKDAQALLRWVNNTYDDPNVQLGLILWGQSIGAGVASTAAAEYIRDSNLPCKAPISGLILETPFSSIKSMLIALYPQRWLPYRYLWPFLWNFWDSELALRKIAEAEHQFKVFLMSATRDEVVPPGEADKLERLCKELGLEMERKDIIGALHTEASTRREGQNAIARFAIEVASGGKGDERFVHGRDSYGLHRRKMM